MQKKALKTSEEKHSHFTVLEDYSVPTQIVCLITVTTNNIITIMF